MTFIAKTALYKLYWIELNTQEGLYSKLLQ